MKMLNKWMWMLGAALSLGAPVTLAAGKAAHVQPPAPKMDGEVDYQDGEDDEVAGLPPVQLKQLRFHGRKVPGLHCSDDGKNPVLAHLLGEAWSHSRNVSDPKVLRSSVDGARKALSVDPKSGQAMVTLASSLAKLGKSDEAGRLYETFVLSCPTHVDSSRILQTLERYERAKHPK